MPRLETVTIGAEVSEIEQTVVYDSEVEETLDKLKAYKIHPGLLTLASAEAEGGYGMVWKAYMSLIAANQIPEGAHGELQYSQGAFWFVTSGEDGEHLTRHVVFQTEAVAVKKLRILDNMDSRDKLNVKRRFVREMLVWAHLNHPNVTRFVGFHLDLDNTDAWLVSSWSDHGNLESYLKTHSLPNIHMMVILEDVASGLGYLHSQEPPIVHGDLKPANVLMTSSRNCRLCDFGLARILDTTSEEGTTAAAFHGSLPWANPEVINGGRPRTSADVWAWGVLAYQVANSGKLPFASEKLQDAVYGARVVEGRLPEALGSLNRLRPILVPLLVQCWGLDAASRPDIVHCYNQIHQVNTVLLQTRTAIWFKLIPRIIVAWYVLYGFISWEVFLIVMDIDAPTWPAHFAIPSFAVLGLFLLIPPVGAFALINKRTSMRDLKKVAAKISQMEINERSTVRYWMRFCAFWLFWTVVVSIPPIMIISICHGYNHPLQFGRDYGSGGFP